MYKQNILIKLNKYIKSFMLLYRNNILYQCINENTKMVKGS
jgi:hypothetical protein